jgi:hypothetical protein
VFIGVLAGIGIPWIQNHGSSSTQNGRRTTELSDQRYVSGDCYIWNQRAASTSATRVPCATPHIYQAVAGLRLPSRYASISYPSAARWAAISRALCRPLDEHFLGYSLDPAGRFFADILFPVPRSWDAGARKVECGLAEKTPRQARRQHMLLPRFAGSVRGASQALLYPTGTCLRFGKTQVQGIVPCGQPHSAIITGTAVASAADPPQSSAFAAAAEPVCLSKATALLGRSFTDTETVRSVWLPIEPGDWTAGDRRYNCVVTYLTAAGKWALVTGRTP